MKIRDLEKGKNIIVYDLGKSEHSEGMTIVGRVIELEYNEDGKNTATIQSVPFQRYTVTDDNYFDYWKDYIESKTERLSENGITVDKKHFDNIDEEHFHHKARVEAMHNAIEETRGYVNEYLSNDVQQRKRKDMVNSPSHYNRGKIEAIVIIEQIASAYPIKVALSIGNTVKYLIRAPFKNGVEDLKKAQWYLNRAIDNWDVK
ncbi:DUF3310 domain-containing protein [Staphylococcus arlettae]|uniref:DUF3310 domain-containing protein n=1 Tax=Staphylococcus arlettae TaxID=29378 RepID=UPI0021D063AB|nr:DUF3310 domain-containing protein [Staphylococcus arlettae]UXU51831.1 DUF3310 domain-containing protein [Staphylococcus arlettae]